MSRTCCIDGCDNVLRPNARLRTCDACRSMLHRWEPRRPAVILARTQHLHKSQARMATFAVVKDAQVQKIGRDRLQEDALLAFPKRRKSNVVPMRRRIAR